MVLEIRCDDHDCLMERDIICAEYRCPESDCTAMISSEAAYGLVSGSGGKAGQPATPIIVVV